MLQTLQSSSVRMPLCKVQSVRECEKGCLISQIFLDIKVGMGNQHSTPKLSLSSHQLPTTPHLNFRANQAKMVQASTVSSALELLKYISIPENTSGLPKYAESVKYNENQCDIIAFLSNSNELVKLLTCDPQTRCEFEALQIMMQNFNALLQKLNTARRKIRATGNQLSEEREVAAHVTSAMDSCTHILKLFQDWKGPLWKVPIPASEILINFASISAETVLWCASALPSHTQTSVTFLVALQQTLGVFKDRCISARLSTIECRARSVLSFGQWEDDKYTMSQMADISASAAPLRATMGEVHLKDKWPTVVTKSGKPVIATWEWNGMGGTKRAIQSACQYRSKIPTVYGQCFDQAIHGVEDVTKLLK